jgi:hypothetical protein
MTTRRERPTTQGALGLIRYGSVAECPDTADKSR